MNTDMKEVLIMREKKKLSKVILSTVMAVIMAFAVVFPGAASANPSPIILQDNIQPAIVSGGNKVVSVTFSVYATQTDPLVDLKNAITVKKTGDAAYTALGTDDTVALSTADTTSTLEINFNDALVGSTNAISIASGVLMDSNGDTFDQVTEIMDIAALDITPPSYIGSSSSNGNDVRLKFDEDIYINNPENEDPSAYLKTKMSIATDGVNFEPLSELGNELTAAGPNEIYIYYSNDMKVIMGTNTLIKIASGAVMDAAGNLNAEMILHVTPPVIQSTEISSDSHDVTITFHEDVVDNTLSEEISYLKDYIYLLKDVANSSQQTELTANDTASVVSGKLVIHFTAALSGAANQIVIRGGALKDSYGNVRNEYITTPLIQALGEPVDTTAPKFVEAYFSNYNQDITFVFDEDVLNNMTDVDLKASIYRYIPGMGWGNGLPSDATLTFSGNTLVIHFAATLTGSQYYFEFGPNFFKDTAGNIFTDYIGTGWLYPLQTLTIQGGSFSHDGRWLSLDSNLNYNAKLVDQTIVNGVSDLKNQITVSTDHGSTFSALDVQDVVTIQGNRIVVLFHEAIKSGTIEVKIAANALSDMGDNVRNAAIDQVIAYNTPDVTGYFLSDTASQFFFEDNAEWRSKVRDVTLYSYNVGASRPLNSSEYTLAAGMLTINQGVFQKGGYYSITINADGYSSKSFSGEAYISSELFYMTAPVVTAENGITAKVNILNYADTNAGTQSVVFELVNGTTPVSIVAANLEVNTGTYTANFNVTDAATNPNYTVRAFMVNKYNNDLMDVGLSLATQVTQAEYDLKLLQQGNNND
ncbi:hemoblobin-interacting domain-containing protein [Cohnella suwonensis]|uniref:Hemoblobin-interacting domain-containing protein n=1 Tax=Cohnella suwonensis TaxID=696072 RepID=A0ABW0M1D5_9BACL